MQEANVFKQVWILPIDHDNIAQSDTHKFIYCSKPKEGTGKIYSSEYSVKMTKIPSIRPYHIECMYCICLKITIGLYLEVKILVLNIIKRFYRSYKTSVD